MTRLGNPGNGHESTFPPALPSLPTWRMPCFGCMIIIPTATANRRDQWGSAGLGYSSTEPRVSEVLRPRKISTKPHRVPCPEQFSFGLNDRRLLSLDTAVRPAR